jgi:uncharacterized membrane protein
MTELLTIIRWIHTLAAAAWLGEVVVINFVLLPVLFRLEPAERGRFLKQVFPRLFKLASHLALATILSGVVFVLLRTQAELALLVTTRWGRVLLLGAIPGLLLALFHFFMEGRLERPMAASESNPASAEMEIVLRRLRIVPRVGLGVILFVFIAMMAAAHGGF